MIEQRNPKGFFVHPWNHPFQKALLILLVFFLPLGLRGQEGLKKLLQMPGKSYQGPLPSLTAQETLVAKTLKKEFSLPPLFLLRILLK